MKYFVEQRGKKSVCLMYQDTDFGKESLIGVNLQTEVMGMKLIASTAHKPTDTDFSANVAKLREANCDLVVLGTIVRDTILIIATARKLGWNVDMMGQIAAYDTAIAEAPGGVGEGFYSMTPSMYAYPDGHVRQCARSCSATRRVTEWTSTISANAATHQLKLRWRRCSARDAI